MHRPVGYKNVLITGASAGIGEELSYWYATPGATLGLISLDREMRLDSVGARCRSKGANVYTYRADVSDAEAMRKCTLDYLDRVTSVDLVIANAGIALTDDKDPLVPSVAVQNMTVNYLGMINTFLPLLPSMKERRSGHLTAISSVSSLRATQNSGSYSASKAAVNLWTEGLRLRLVPYGIHVTTLCVGFVDTAMTRDNSFWMPGLIGAQKAARLIATAIERRKRIKTLPWQSRLIWNFLHVLPGRFYDRVIIRAKAIQDGRKIKNTEYQNEI